MSDHDAGYAHGVVQPGQAAGVLDQPGGALMKATPRSKPHPPECDRLMAEYSALKVRLDFGGTFHEHYPREWPAWDGPPAPEHCGWPAWLRPSGWQCRQCGAALAVESAA
jgi:hypothetical protein